MPAQCWLHPTGEEHDVTLLVGVRVDEDTQRVVPADLRCARQVPDDLMVDATQINVEVIRS